MKIFQYENWFPRLSLLFAQFELWFVIDLKRVLVLETIASNAQMRHQWSVCVANFANVQPLLLDNCKMYFQPPDKSAFNINFEIYSISSDFWLKQPFFYRINANLIFSVCASGKTSSCLWAFSLLSIRMLSSVMCFLIGT